MASGWRLTGGIVLVLLAAVGVRCGFSDPATERERMVTEQLAGRGISDPVVLGAMRTVPREAFVPAALKPMAYADQPLPIGEGQTISQPLIVAMMTELSGAKRGSKVLEVGTGSGYQAAILDHIGARVHSIEILPGLAESARRALQETGHAGVQVRTGDGYQGWPEAAPFDAILVTCAPAAIPEPLKKQLASGGKIVIPVGPVGEVQRLVVVTRGATDFTERTVDMVRFVPMVRATGSAPEAPATPGAPASPTAP